MIIHNIAQVIKKPSAAVSAAPPVAMTTTTTSPPTGGLIGGIDEFLIDVSSTPAQEATPTITPEVEEGFKRYTMSSLTS